MRINKPLFLALALLPFGLALGNETQVTLIGISLKHFAHHEETRITKGYTEASVSAQRAVFSPGTRILKLELPELKIEPDLLLKSSTGTLQNNTLTLEKQVELNLRQDGQTYRFVTDELKANLQNNTFESRSPKLTLTLGAS